MEYFLDKERKVSESNIGPRMGGYEYMIECANKKNKNITCGLEKRYTVIFSYYNTIVFFS